MPLHVLQLLDGVVEEGYCVRELGKHRSGGGLGSTFWAERRLRMPKVWYPSGQQLFEFTLFLVTRSQRPSSWYRVFAISHTASIYPSTTLQPLSVPSMPTRTASIKSPKEVPEDDPDDYMSMAIAEPAEKTYETSAQRRRRKEREAEARSRPPSARESALVEPEPIAPTSKGFKMLAALGYKPGATLGAENNPNAILQPIEVEVKEDKAGIGLESDKKRKLRKEWEKVEGMEKRMKAEEGEYRVRVANEREERRVEGLWWNAMRALEGLEDSATEKKDTHGWTPTADDQTRALAAKRLKRPLKGIDLLYRPLIKDRVEKERERRMRHDLQQSSTRNANYNDPEEDDYDKLAFGTEEEELIEVDEELEQYIAMTPAERLEKTVSALRDRWNYCFWCKYRYEDDAMEGCPGLDEDSHG